MKPSEALDEAIRLDPNNTLAWENKGWTLSCLHKYDGAIEAYDEAIKLDPDDPDDWNNKGLALEFQGKNDEAIEAYDMAIKLDPTYSQASYNKATLSMTRAIL